MMIEGPDFLRQWLTNTLKPICDAEPGALAKYVMALLKKDKSEQDLKDFCIDQLDVFLQKETKVFVDGLFEVVKDKSYLPGGKSSSEPLKPSQPASSRPMIADETAVTSTTLSVPRADDGLSRSPGPDGSRPKRKRIEAPPRDEKPPIGAHHEREARREHKRSRSPRSRSRERNGRVRGTGGRARSGRRRSRTRSRERMTARTANKEPTSVTGKLEPRSKDTPPHNSNAEESTSANGNNVDMAKDTKKSRKTRCRDYDEKGYCMRGDRCSFDHGPDPVVVDGPDLPGMITVAGSSATTTTQTTSKRTAMIAPPPNFSVPPPGYTPLNPPPPGVDTAYVPQSTVVPPPTSGAEGYNPEAPSIETPVTAGNIPVPPPGFTHPPPPLPGVTPWPAPAFPGAVVLRPEMGIKRQLITVAGSEQMSSEAAAKRGRGLYERLGPRPRFQGPNPRSENKTLQVRKIPPNLNNIAKLNEHFGQFGQITNIQVRFENDPEGALITYANRYQAMSAYKSTAPILNNRFIKVFWHGGGENDQNQMFGVKSRLGVKPEQSSDNDAVTFSARGSLSKTIYNQGALGSNSSQMSLQSNPTPVQQQTSPVESYVAVRKRRKMERQKKMAYMELYKKKSLLLSKQLEQQKILVKQMEKSKATDEQKKELMNMYKVLDKSLNTLKTELDDVTRKLSALDAASQLANERAAASKTKEQLEKEKLDIELEMMSQRQVGGDTETLQKRLGELKTELLGMETQPSAESGPATSTPVQPETLAARRSSTGGKKRGLIPHTATLDKRPRNLVVTGFSVDEKDAVIAHLQQFGDLEDLEFDKSKDQPRALVVYKTRKDAEEAVALAPDFQERTISVQWASSASASSGSVSQESQSSSVVPDTNRPPSDQVTAVELLASLGDDDMSDDSEGHRNDDGYEDDEAFDYEED